MRNNAIINFKKTSCILLSFILMGGALPCYGEESAGEEIDITKFPAYFNTDTWREIKRANEKNKLGVGKIVAIMDGPVEYIAGLTEQNDQNIQQQINRGSIVTDPYHGTAVASLIASKPCKLPCHNENGFTSKLCNEPEIVVAGIAQHVKMVNILTSKQPYEVEDSIEELVTNVDPLTDQERRDIRTFRKQVPARVILNFSIGPSETKSQVLQNIKKQYMTIKSSSAHNSDKYFLIQFLIEYIDNGMKWIPPKSNLSEWNRMKLQRENEGKGIEKILKDHDIEVEHLVDAAKDNILTRKDYFLAVVAAGNSGEKLEHDKAGLLVKIGKTTTENDPIIGVAAGCGKDRKKLCSWSNYSNTLVDILAPGENIPVIFTEKSNNNTIAKATHANGTSFAAPLVTGTVALLAQCEPTASTRDIKKVIFENADSDPKLKSKIIDGKILNVEKAVKFMCKTEAYPRPEKPKITEDVSPHDDL